MAFIEKAVSLGTNDTLVYECPATNSGSMHGLVFSNTSNIQVAVTIKLYQHSSGVTLDIAKDRIVSANGEFTWPKPINLADGDKIIALADVDGVVAAIASVYLVTSIVAGGPLTPRGTWSSLATYKTNDIVVHNGTSYIAVSSSTNVTPPSSAWMVLVTAFSGSYDDLTNKPSLFSGSYNDLVDKPELVVDYNDLTNKPTLFSGSYTDLTDTAHASRHLPNGTDPLATGAAVSLSTSSANAVGIANSFARADHTHALDGVQASSPELTAIISQTGTGLATRTGTNTWATRQITSSSGALTISNGNGVAGNIDINYAVACTPGTYTSVTVDQYGVVTSGATSQSWSTLTGTPTTLSGYGITDSQPLNTNLNALASTSTAGFYAITGGGTSVTRSLTAPAAGITITNTDGVGGNPTFALANDLAAVEALTGTGIAIRTAADTWATRSLTAPAAGITITNTDGVGGNPTFALANDLAAVEAMTGVGLSVRTATDTWASRTLTGTARVSITNGSGVSDNPIIDLAPIGTAGTYARVTTDAYGRVVSGTPMTGLAGQQMATVIAAATTTSVIAFNNSAPTSTAGALLTSITITPTSANSTFMGVIAVTVDTAVSARNVVITIFRGTTLVGMGVTNNTTNARPQSLSVTFFDAPATTSDVTYDVRIGQNLSGITYVNTTATASFGNAAKSAFIVSETL